MAGGVPEAAAGGAESSESSSGGLRVLSFSAGTPTREPSLPSQLLHDRAAFTKFRPSVPTGEI